MDNFNTLGLSPSTLEVLKQIGFTKPTPVQEEAIPILLKNDPTDFIGLAQTGTGKTAAFGLPLLELLDDEQRSVQALIMAPTRELGQQISQQLKTFSGHRKLHTAVVYGGASISGQIKTLSKPTQIVVATPGRLIDLLGRKAIKLDQVRYVILDEADEMLNMGFKEAIDEILEHTPENRVTWLFSATMPDEIRRITGKYMKNPREVRVNSQQKTNADIAHQYIVSKTANKIPALRRFMDIQPEMRGILFCRTKRETQQIADLLNQQGYSVEALHGDLSQAQRDTVMKRFKSRSMQLLIATDVAARGIDVNDLTHVIHHTLPDQLESYTHRSGRTGRAGNKGISLAFINPREMRKISELEKRSNIRFEPVEIPRLEQIKSSRIDHWARLIINTRVDQEADEILHSVANQFSKLSKEDLLKRLITTQLDHLMIRSGEDEDLNENTGKPKSAGKRTGTYRFFINVGMMDGFTKADLVHFMSDVAEVGRENFSNVEMMKSCSYFDLNSQAEKGFSQKFESIEIQGRAIRANRDDEGRKSHPAYPVPAKRKKHTVPNRRTNSRRQRRKGR